MPKESLPSIRLTIVLTEAPAGVDYALQKGSGNNYECIQTQKSTGGDLKFECSIELKKTKTGAHDFAGPFVQGKSGERFLYIDIGTAAHQFGSEWTRRLKIPLTGITPTMLADIAGNGAKSLQTIVPGKGKDGTPNCATVKPFNGWSVI